MRVKPFLAIVLLWKIRWRWLISNGILRMAQLCTLFSIRVSAHSLLHRCTVSLVISENLKQLQAWNIWIQRRWRIWAICSLPAQNSPLSTSLTSIPRMWRIWSECSITAQLSPLSTSLSSIQGMWRIWDTCSVPAQLSPLSTSLSSIQGMWLIWATCSITVQNSPHSMSLSSIPQRWRIWATCS